VDSNGVFNEIDIGPQLACRNVFRVFNQTLQDWGKDWPRPGNHIATSNKVYVLHRKAAGEQGKGAEWKFDLMKKVAYMDGVRYEKATVCSKPNQEEFMPHCCVRKSVKRPNKPSQQTVASMIANLASF